MKVKRFEDFLTSNEYLSDLSPDDLSLIAGCARPMPYAEGTVIAREGDPADWFFVIREGIVALEIHVPHRGAIVVDTAGEGEIVGYSWIVPPYRWQVDVRAVTPVRAIWLDGACLRQKCEEDPRLGYALVKRFAGLLHDRLDSARVRLVDVYGDARSG